MKKKIIQSCKYLPVRISVRFIFIIFWAITGILQPALDPVPTNIHRKDVEAKTND